MVFLGGAVLANIMRDRDAVSVYLYMHISILFAFHFVTLRYK